LIVCKLQEEVKRTIVNKNIDKSNPLIYYNTMGKFRILSTAFALCVQAVLGAFTAPQRQSLRAAILSKTQEAQFPDAKFEEFLTFLEAKTKEQDINLPQDPSAFPAGVLVDMFFEPWQASLIDDVGGGLTKSHYICLATI